jgi:membrane-associated PAP2 superfamily phosphatase
MSIKREIIITIIILLLTTLFFGFSSIDNMVQDNFYEQSRKTWILNRDLQPYKFIFYDGIKKLLIVVALFFLMALIFFRKNTTIQAYKRGLLIVVLSAIFVPLIVGGLKKATNMPCPKNEIRYGGEYPATKVWEHYPQTFQKKEKICCFPAGHASGGFALLSLFFLFKTRRNKILAVLSALTVGWSMGIYKMLIGDHFLSHTVITMILAWIIILIIQKIVYRNGTIHKKMTKGDS